MEGFVEYINYLYYSGVLQNLQKQLTKSSNENNDSFQRAIQSIEEKIKDYESKPEKQKKGHFLKDTFNSYRSIASRDFKGFEKI